METFAYFNGIHHQIIKELEKAKFEIIIAVAWFTDREIFQLVCKKAVKGVSVSITLMDDSINKRAPFEYDQLRDSGGKIYLIPGGKSKLMHHKFCVIDRKKVITGSFNWSKSARKNDENIVVIHDADDFSMQYIDTFNQILAKNNYAVIDIPKLDTESIARRLEVINNFILLGEYNDVAKHISKLKDLANEDRLITIITAIEQQNYDFARTFIVEYLSKLRSLVKFNDPIIARMKQELLTLEYQLNALSDEKAEISRQIHIFNYQYNLYLGDLILEYLQLRKAKTKENYEEAKENQQDEETLKELQEEYQEAQSDQEQFQEGYDVFQNEDEIAQLNTEDAKELKKLYRKSSMLCHPDRVSESDKKRAHEIFVELQKANNSNNLERIREIYNNLKEGNLFTDISSEASEIEQLEKLISDLKIKNDKLMNDISEAVNSEIYQILKDIKNWEPYFKSQVSQYEQEIEILREEVHE